MQLIIVLEILRKMIISAVAKSFERKRVQLGDKIKVSLCPPRVHVPLSGKLGLICPYLLMIFLFLR